jgi:hypothetical protein
MSKKERDKRNLILLFSSVVILLLLLLRRKTTTLTAAPLQTFLPQTSYAGFTSSGGGGGGSYSNVSTNVVTAETDLTGIAPTGAKFGINISSGRTFYVDILGNWQPSLLPVSGYSPLTGTFAPVHLDNSQAFTSDVTITGVLLSNHYSLSVTTDLHDFTGIDVQMNVVANNKVRVTAWNNTGNTISLPELTISALQLN